jgi:hypothetical protein
MIGFFFPLRASVDALPATDHEVALRDTKPLNEAPPWNLQHCGGARLVRIADAIIGHDPDVIALSEFRTKPGAVLCSRFNAAGWPHVETTNPVGSDNGMAVFSRTPLIRAHPCSSPPETLSDGWTSTGRSMTMDSACCISCARCRS